jgi:hypothetical protein
MQFAFAKSVIIEGVPVPPPRPLEPFKAVELWNKLTSFGIDLNKLSFKEAGGRGKLVKQKSRKLELIQNDFQREPVRVHAEVQLLMKLLGSRLGEKPIVGEIDYIGCSKKSCHLCWQLLQGFYQVRGSHGQIWPRWTIPPTPGLATYTSLKLHARVSNIGASMIKRLCGPMGPHLQSKAHSTPAVTETLSSVAFRNNRRLLDHERSHYRRKATGTLPELKLGPIKRHIRVLLIPDDGSRMRLITVPIRETLKTYYAKDKFQQYVPDFREFWPGELNFERGYHNWSTENQESVSEGHNVLNGLYIAYYNQSEELRRNEYLRKTILSGAIPFDRKFWNGDVFVLRRGTRMIEKTPLFPDDPKNELMEVDYEDGGAAMYDDVRPPSLPPLLPQ